jgi:HEAT repeat protein
MKTRIGTTAALLAFAFVATSFSNPQARPPRASTLALLCELRMELADEERGELIYEIGERRAVEAVECLTRILDEDDNEGVRIMAALALRKIGDDVGLDAVKHAAIYDDSGYVRKMCGVFYVDWRLSMTANLPQ